jgi:hypothetical protein
MAWGSRDSEYPFVDTGETWECGDAWQGAVLELPISVECTEYEITCGEGEPPAPCRM